LRKKFGVAGRERVIRRFDLEKRTKVLETIYARVSGIGIRVTGVGDREVRASRGRASGNHGPGSYGLIVKVHA